jgi:hypothetical protein
MLKKIQVKKRVAALSFTKKGTAAVKQADNPWMFLR